METKIMKFLIVMLLNLMIFVAVSFATESYVDNEVIIKYKNGIVATKNMALNSRSIMATETMPEYVDENIFLMKTRDNVTNTINTLINDPDIEYVQPNFKKYAFRVPNDPTFSDYPENRYQTEPKTGINATLAWDQITDASNIKVAVIDTGIRRTHEDLKANIVVSDGFDAFADNNGGEDADGHGTHVAGIIGAVGNNGVGIAGVTWKTKLIPIRVLKNGKGSSTTIVKGMKHALAINARVANMSLGSEYDPNGQFDRSEYDTLKDIISKGIVVIAAAGNDNKNTDWQQELPAAYGLRGLISVGASDIRSDRASFAPPNATCYGRTTVHLFAPGNRIYSTYHTNDQNYAYMSGTSMATPVVTGAVALMLEKDPTLKPAEIEQILVNAVRDVESLRDYSMSGGILDLPKALNFDKNLLFNAPENLQLSMVSGTGRTVRLSWAPHSGQTEIWSKTGKTANFTLLDRIAPGTSEYIDRVDGDATGQRYYRIRGLRHGTYTPFVRKSVINPNDKFQLVLAQEFIDITAPKPGEASSSTKYMVEPDTTILIPSDPDPIKPPVDPNNPPPAEGEPARTDIFKIQPATLTFVATIKDKISLPQKILLTNISATDITISLLKLPSGFNYTSAKTCINNATLLANESCTIVIEFNPTDIGNYDVTSYISDQNNHSVEYRLIGKGISDTKNKPLSGCNTSDRPDYLFALLIILAIITLITRKGRKVNE